MSFSLEGADKIAGYVAGQWIDAPNDNLTQFKLTQDPAENMPLFTMETKPEFPIDASPAEVLLPIINYNNYTAAGMPRTYKSQVLHTFNNATFTLVQGKQKKTSVPLVNATINIATFSLALGGILPDAHYTELLAHTTDPETNYIHVYWVQYDKDNLDAITGPWKTIAPIPYEPGTFWGYNAKSEYPNTSEDLYGSWTLVPVGENQTHIHYESYADPGKKGRLPGIKGKVIGDSVIDYTKIIRIVEENLP